MVLVHGIVEIEANGMVVATVQPGVGIGLVHGGNTVGEFVQKLGIEASCARDFKH